MQFQAFFYNVFLCPCDKWGFYSQFMAAALINCCFHRIIKDGAAIRICISSGIICMGSVINHFAAIWQCHTGSRCQKQTVPERHIRGNRCTIGFFQLFCIAFLRNFFCRIFQQAAIGICKNSSQVQLFPGNTIIIDDFLCSFQFLFMLLSIINRKCQYFRCSVLFNCQCQCGSAIYAAAE